MRKSAVSARRLDFDDRAGEIANDVADELRLGFFHLKTIVYYGCSI
jgi:hypothetical protein